MRLRNAIHLNAAQGGRIYLDKLNSRDGVETEPHPPPSARLIVLDSEVLKSNCILLSIC